MAIESYDQFLVDRKRNLIKKLEHYNVTIWTI